jgi:hypothetical protein
LILKDPYIHITSPNAAKECYLCGIDPEKVIVGIVPAMLHEFPAALICAKCRAMHESSTPK